MQQPPYNSSTSITEAHNSRGHLLALFLYDKSGWRIEDGGFNNQPLPGERQRQAYVAADWRRKGAAASNESVNAHTMAGDDGSRQQTMEQMEDNEAGRDTATNHQQKSGKDMQWLATRARGQWMAMGSKRGRWPLTKRQHLQ